MFGSKKKKKLTLVKEKKKKTKTEEKKAGKKSSKSFLRPIKERKPREKKAKVAKEETPYVEESAPIEYHKKPLKLQEKKILTAEGWKRLLKKN